MGKQAHWGREWPGSAESSPVVGDRGLGKAALLGFGLRNVTEGERTEDIGRRVLANPGNLGWTRKKVKTREVRGAGRLGPPAPEMPIFCVLISEAKVHSHVRWKSLRWGRERKVGP